MIPRSPRTEVTSDHRSTGRGRIAGLLAAVTLLGAAGLMSGCLIAPLLASNEYKGSHDVTAKYTGLKGKSFAVVISADRVVQADFPQLVNQLTTTIANHIQKHVDASGWVPPESVLAFQYKNPRWSIMRVDELAKALGVDRLVYIELTEFRLTEPGNQYLWRGAASAKVGVIEADGPVSDSFIYQEQVRVEYPIKERAIGPAQLSEDQVEITLAKKFAEYAGRLFYDHVEKNSPSDAE